MQHCPACKSEDVHRSRVRTRWESWRKEVTGKRPFRCHGCGWRGWSFDSGPRFGDETAQLAARAMAPDPPNLKATTLAFDEGRADLKLDQLDSLAALPERTE